jgi:hypothetical protein
MSAHNGAAPAVEEIIKDRDRKKLNSLRIGFPALSVPNSSSMPVSDLAPRTVLNLVHGRCLNIEQVDADIGAYPRSVSF